MSAELRLKTGQHGHGRGKNHSYFERFTRSDPETYAQMDISLVFYLHMRA